MFTHIRKAGFPSRRFDFRALAIGVVCLLFVGGASRAAVYFVDNSAVDGLGTGASWADAFVDLQEALAVAQPGDEIRIAQGVYVPGQSRHDAFELRPGVIVSGGFGGLGASDPDAVDVEAYPVELSGDIGIPGDAADNCFHVVIAGPLVRQDTVLRGVTITGGNANFPRDVPDLDNVGGGITCVGQAAPTIEACTFQGNYARLWGGAIAAENGAVRIRSCRFVHNRVNANAGGVAGAIYFAGNATVEACVFEHNGPAASAGAILAAGAGVIWGCTFRHNTADDAGGAMTGWNFAVVNCTFENNTATWGGAIWGDGKLVNCQFIDNNAVQAGAVRTRQLQAVNCMFMGNVAFAGTGGAVEVLNDDEATATLINCTLVGNSAASRAPNTGGGGIGTGGNLVLLNCILWENHAQGTTTLQAQQIAKTDAESSIEVHHSCIMGWTGSLKGTSNTGSDPLFVSVNEPDNGDDGVKLRSARYAAAAIRLSIHSPCLNAGENSFLPADVLDIDRDGNTEEPISLDLTGGKRLVGGTVDIGAIESQRGCLSDVAQPYDGVVNVSDLLALISQWGPCNPENPRNLGAAFPAACDADLVPLGGDGNVDVSDLLQLLADWGLCEESSSTAAVISP